MWPPDTVNMAEAVATGDYAEVTRQLEHGVDPNPAMDVRARLLQSKPMRVTPLQAAVWARTPRMVTILLEGGAILSPTSLAVLKCMNDDNRNSEVRALLDAVVTEGELPCAGLNVPRP